MTKSADNDRPTIDGLPPEIKRIIIGLTAQSDTTRLARINSTWRELAEEKMYNDIEYEPEPDQNVYKEEAQRITTWCSKIAESIRSRPTRSTYIRKLTVPAAYDAFHDMCDILDACSPSLISLRQQDFFDFGANEEYFDPLASALAHALPMTNLTNLGIQLGTFFEHELFAALGSTTHLVTLFVTASRPPDPFDNFVPNDAVRLPKLLRFDLLSIRWERVLAAIIACSPNLIELYLGEQETWDDDGPALENALACTSLTRFCVYTEELSERIVARSRDQGASQIFPGLKEMMVATKWGPGCLPLHPTVEAIKVSYPVELHAFEYYSATVENRHVVGHIAPWFIDLLDGLPRVTTITLEPRFITHLSERDCGPHEPYGTFRIASYVPEFGQDPDNCLYTIYFQTYDATDDQSHAHIFHESIHPTDDLAETLVDALTFGSDIDYWLTPSPASDFGDTEHRRVGVAFLAVSYRGVPLPRGMMGYIYYELERAGLEDDTGRDQPMPPDVAFLLDGWFARLEATGIAENDPSTRSHNSDGEERSKDGGSEEEDDDDDGDLKEEADDVDSTLDIEHDEGEGGHEDDSDADDDEGETDDIDSA